MKYVLLIVTIASLCSCAGPGAGPSHTSDRYPASSSAELEPKKHSRYQYEGYWRQTNGNVIFVDANYENEDKGIVTKLKGLDLNPDFGYPSVAFADGDAFEIVFNPDRNLHESVFEKKIGGRPVLFELAYTLASENQLRINVRTAEKTVVHEFTRLTDDAKADELMRNIQIPRTRILLRSHRDSMQNTSCEPWAIELEAERGNFRCVKALIENGAPFRRFGLLSATTKSGEVELVKYLLSKGLPADEKDSYGGTPLEYLSGSISSATVVGDHGWVSKQLDKYEIIKALINAGAAFTSRMATGCCAALAPSSKRWNRAKAPT